MSKITQKQLISQLKELKEIKPRQEWVSLLKSQIIVEKKAEVQTKVIDNPAQFAGFASIMDMFSSTVFQKRLAYSLATLALMIVGVLGFVKYESPASVKQVAVQSQASLLGQVALKQNATNLSNKVNGLAQATKSNRAAATSSALRDINSNAKDLAESLKTNKTNDPETLKEIAVSLKTLADVSGTDLTKNPDVNDLYQTVVENQISDLQKTTLTDNQKIILTKAEDLYKAGKYSDALEQILLINQ